VCEACTVAKARQKDVPQDSECIWGEAGTVKLNKKADANENKKDEKGTPEFEEAAAPKDGEGNKKADADESKKDEKGGQLFTDDDAHKNTQGRGATGTGLKPTEEEADSLNSSRESESSNENESQAVPSDEDEEAEVTTTTRSGRAVRPPERYRETSAASFEVGPSPAEQQFFHEMKHCYELSMEYVDKPELHKDDDKETSKDPIHEEIDSTWEMKLKASGQDPFMQYESTDWQLVAPKKKRKDVSGHGSSRGNTHGPKKKRQTGNSHGHGSHGKSGRGSSHGFDRGERARGEGVGDELGATGTLARGSRRTTPVQKSKVKFSTETK
jgi:hypothetical protein